MNNVKKYPDKRSLVRVTIDSGEVLTASVSAGPSISDHILKQARESGFLVLRDETNGTGLMVRMSNVTKIEFKPEVTE